VIGLLGGFNCNFSLDEYFGKYIQAHAIHGDKPFRMSSLQYNSWNKVKVTQPTVISLLGVFIAISAPEKTSRKTFKLTQPTVIGL
jgi:hypothetical protein